MYLYPCNHVPVSVCTLIAVSLYPADKQEYVYEDLYEYGLAEGLEPAPDDLPRTAELVCRLMLVTLLRHTGCDATSVQHTRSVTALGPPPCGTQSQAVTAAVLGAVRRNLRSLMNE